MLPAGARVHTRHDHRLVSQTGCRVRRGALVLALAASGGDSGPRATVIAGRRVGPSVVRNRVKRRVRELVRARLSDLPAGSMLVVRALPGSADADFAQLGGWVDSGLRKCVAQTSSGSAPGGQR